MPSDQLSLGLGERHAGQAANLAAGQKGYRDDRHRVETAVATLARSGAEFTADDVHRLVQHDGGTGYDRNLVSSVLGIWAKEGRIKRIAYAVSTSKSRHASKNGVWRGARHGQIPEARRG
ncbi:hypothetical protein [Prauserella endophytica]|uniref:Uncharacterized protein n=1 Tax=Prauserella endophytica TaxID=1592324 RepID=A0ABY2S035_9PSEU|nr:hypothetical protein [Prauserella endophytica]PXY20349.1 hypothetical protein BAY59_31420 [Prauserella coralliicola]TKG66951.1 hypothetical protein FCN18_23865 [Prauserella endophytica]